MDKTTNNTTANSTQSKVVGRIGQALREVDAEILKLQKKQKEGKLKPKEAMKLNFLLKNKAQRDAEEKLKRKEEEDERKIQAVKDKKQKKKDKRKAQDAKRIEQLRLEKIRL